MRDSKQRKGARRRGIYARAYLPLLMLILVGAVVAFARTVSMAAQRAGQSPSASQPVAAGAYLYYTLKQAGGFALARAPKGNNYQPLGTPQVIASFGNGFGQVASDQIFSMQLSPDGRYLAIDGSQDHGELVWVFDTQRAALTTVPANVFGNFLHWLPGTSGSGHDFLYRPMFPLGPNAPLDNGVWNPGLWVVDAATGTHRNIDIHTSAAFLVDATPSPDGSRIIYSTSEGVGLGSDTWLMNSDGSSITRLLHLAGGAQSIAGMFAWSPDGKTVAYERLSDGPTPFLPAGLWTMRSDGTQQVRLADADGGHGFTLAWSPDSLRIAYVARTNVSDRQADYSMQALQSAVAVVDVSSRRSWLVATPQQTGMQINDAPLWVGGQDVRLTFLAYNPFNLALGGTPRYWSAQVSEQLAAPTVIPLTPSLSHVVAFGV